MINKSIFWKIFGVYLLSTTVLCTLIVLFSYYLIRNSHIDNTARYLKDLAIVLQEEITPLIDANNTADLEKTVKKIGPLINTRITIMGVDGTVLSDSEQDPLKMENHQTRTEMAQALEGQTGQSLRVSGTLGQEMLYVAVPVLKDGSKILYVLRVSRYLSGISVIIRDLIKQIVTITIIMDILGLLFAFLFSRNISRAVNKLKSAFHRATLKNFDVRVFFKRNDELKTLADSFNAMISQMQELFGELSHQKEELNGIVSSLQEGLLTLDSDDRVLLANTSIKAIAGRNLEEGRPYWETIREPKLNEIVHQARTLQQSISEEIELNNRIFLCSATYLSSKKEITIIFHDVTEIKKLEKLKTDFVVNVSHELRTPLTSIKGFIETIQASALSEENRHYLDIIRRNTDRLTSIVNDLLTLSDLEEKTSRLEMEPTDIQLLIGHVLAIFEPQIKNKGLSLNVSISPDLPSIKADQYRLEQAFINVLDNALKYTETGEISVRIKHEHGKVVITFEDTGIGIPPYHLSRIFERFYVADKSRSRKLGGTGLGLSIVKHIILLHNGSIDVKSIPGQGTTFVVTLPV